MYLFYSFIQSLGKQVSETCHLQGPRPWWCPTPGSSQAGGQEDVPHWAQPEAWRHIGAEKGHRAHVIRTGKEMSHGGQVPGAEGAACPKDCAKERREASVAGTRKVRGKCGGEEWGQGGSTDFAGPLGCAEGPSLRVMGSH